MGEYDEWVFLWIFPIVNECFSGFSHPSRLMHDLANPWREQAFR